MSRGSSPHTRGAPSLKPGVSNGERIIPAYAGSTSAAADSCRRLWDHPRIRGEHPRIVSTNICGHRIIPAYAGSTAPARRRPSGRRDHPRIRGEHRGMCPTSPSPPGSSPHTRGALKTTIRAFLNARIIPAYAGSTVASGSRSQPRADHPRIRGEHCALSPLGR